MYSLHPFSHTHAQTPTGRSEKQQERNNNCNGVGAGIREELGRGRRYGQRAGGEKVEERGAAAEEVGGRESKEEWQQ